MAIQTGERQLRSSSQTRAAARFRQEETLRTIGKGVKTGVRPVWSGSLVGGLALVEMVASSEREADEPEANATDHYQSLTFPARWLVSANGWGTRMLLSLVGTSGHERCGGVAQWPSGKVT